MLLRIGLTQGDPHGVGPELCVLAQQHFAQHQGIELALFGNTDRIGPDASVCPKQAGEQSAQYVREAVDAVLRGDIDTIVTAPINKHHWQLAGIDAPGHTEWLARCVDANNPPSTHMLFCADNLRIALASLHVPLRDVADHITPDKIVTLAMQLNAFLQQHCGITKPRLACLGLNPHAGEQGQLGWEEQERIIPAIQQARERGFEIDGPFPADTFFGWVQQANTPYDAIIAMYHDQGLVPIKTLYPHTAVNVTVGLPFIRTSVGHGTASDIAGTGAVDPRNMIAAIECAYNLHNKG